MVNVMVHKWRSGIWLMNPSVHVSIQHSAVSIVCLCARVPEARITSVMRATGAGGPILALESALMRRRLICIHWCLTRIV